VPQILIDIYLRGYANRPKIEFDSDPQCPKRYCVISDIGTSTKKLATGDSSISKEAGLFIFNHVARDLAYEIGFG